MNRSGKLFLRSPEFLEVRVAETSSRRLPRSGFDFDVLISRSDRVIEIFLGGGTVQNDALVHPEGSVPDELHAVLRETCGYTAAKRCEAFASLTAPESMLVSGLPDVPQIIQRSHQLAVG